MKDILVIGGSYFVGRVFVEELAENPAYRIHVLNRGTRPLNLDGVKEIVCDRNDIPRLKKALPLLKWHAVVDFCGYTQQDVMTLLLVMPKNSVGHYIFISSVAVYESTRALPIKEDSLKINARQPELGPNADYGYNKWLAELAVAAHCIPEKTPYTCLRPTIIYGKHNYLARESYFFDLILNKKTVVLPENDLVLFQLVSVWDVAKIITLCMGNPATFSKAFNLAAEDLVSYGRFIDVMEEITGNNIPTRNLFIAAMNGRKTQPPFPLDRHLIYSGALIQNTLGFQYTPFMQGMKRTWEWYRQTAETTA